MWKRVSEGLRGGRGGTTTRRLCTSSTQRRRIVEEDQGDWSYSSEWWGGSNSCGRTILRSASRSGNGDVSVVAFPASSPSRACWAETERWLASRFREVTRAEERFRVMWYQWRALRFNDDTRQSAVKVMAAYPESSPGSLCLMQLPDCLAVPYLKSMVSVGLATIASCNFDLTSAACGKRAMHILCIGHGGGSLPLFLAKNIPGAVIHTVEIDPLVISASISAMGFPAYSLISSSGQRVISKPDTLSDVLWKGIHERLSLFESDAEQFVHNTKHVYDLVFIDAYDGDDIFPRKLWDPDSPFLEALSSRVHPAHGTVVVNLHSDDDASTSPSKYVNKVCRAYKDALVAEGASLSGRGRAGTAFTVAVPWLYNTSMVVCRGQLCDVGDSIWSTIASKSLEVEKVLNFPFSCLEYIKSGLTLVD